MNQPFIIGVGHRARNGKDTLAAYLQALSPFEIKVFSFASALKGFCRTMGWMQEKDGPLLQFIGTECFRKADPDIWVKIVLREIEESGCRVAILPDCRFLNELKLIRDTGGMAIRVRRILPDGSFYLDPNRPADHPSECALDNAEFDLTVDAKDGELKTIFTAAVSIHAELVDRGILPPISTLDGRSYFERAFV